MQSNSQFLHFQVGAAQLTLPAEEILEIIRPPRVTRVPLGPASLLGIANLRGTVFPIVSLHKLLNVQDERASPAQRVIVVKQGAPIGFMVDQVLGLSAERGSADEHHAGENAAALPGKSAKTVAQSLNVSALLERDFKRGVRGGQVSGDALIPLSARETEDGKAAAKDELALISFTLADQTFAFPLADIGEIIAAPPAIDQLPGADAVIGMIAFRDSVLPIASPHILLNLPLPGERREQDAKILVVATALGRVGLLIEGNAAIARVPSSAVDAVPGILKRGGGEAKIGAICRMENGRSLIYILSAEKLFHNPKLSQALEREDVADGETLVTGDEASEKEQFIIFEIGTETYGIPIQAVEEVVRLPESLTRVPKAPAFIQGVINLRGKVVPVIDQRRRFDAQPREAIAQAPRVMVVKIGHLQAGFIVDAVSEVLSVPSRALLPAPDLASGDARIIDRVATISVHDRMILVIDPRELLNHAEKDLLLSLQQDEAAPSLP